MLRPVAGLIAMAFGSSALAQTASWDGIWSGRIDSGSTVQIVISGNAVQSYRFNGRSAPFVYASVKDHEVSFSPGASTMVTLAPAGNGQARYLYSNPMRGNSSGMLTRAAAPAPQNVRIGSEWLGVWGRVGSIRMNVRPNGIDYTYQGKSYEISQIKANNRTLAFRIGEAAHLSLSLRPDRRADYVYTLDGKVTRGEIWRGSAEN
jgi:hypothetical protein